jgi:pSer/pThr/pTyr-binding forkhead associated (FHA) protein
MPGKITITVKRGLHQGKTFSYSAKESLCSGQKKSCSICFPERTVSRYHCLIDIAPPMVMVRDFGSKNGTWLNGSVIGQRPADMSPEDAQKNRFNFEHEIHDGDTLQLGPDCELSFQIENSACLRNLRRRVEAGGNRAQSGRQTHLLRLPASAEGSGTGQTGGGRRRTPPADRTRAQRTGSD